MVKPLAIRKLAEDPGAAWAHTAFLGKSSGVNPPEADLCNPVAQTTCDSSCGLSVANCDSAAAPRQRRFYVSEFLAARRCIAALSGAALPRLWNEIVPGGLPSPSF